MATAYGEKATILGCGYVGQAVARQWQSQGIAVTATTTTPSRLTVIEKVAQQAILVTGDDPDALADLLRDQTILLVSVGAPNPDAYRETYLRTAETLATVLPHTPVTQVIYTGSYVVYGDRQGARVTEANAPAPTTPKGEILAQTEQVLLDMATSKRRVCVFRLGGIYGPERELVKIFRRAAGTTRSGTGDDATNWIHLDDIVSAIDFAQQQRLNGIYNLVQDDPPTTGELLRYVMEANGLDPIHWNPDEPSSRAYNARVSNTTLKQQGYQFIRPLFPFQRES
ncbi:MAG: SDR family oxidoreductase [Elainellaceae cyanobacterium]